MIRRRVAVIPGDGIGKEVVPVAVEVIKAAVLASGRADLEFIHLPWGCDYYLMEGRMMPEDGIDILRAFDAIFLGAIGDPGRVPDNISLWGLLIRIRRGLHQSINVRPARFMDGMPSPLRDPRGFDFVVIRENSEGEYSQIGGRIHDGPRETALQVSVFTRDATERVIRYAFHAARRRRHLLTSATKSNGIYHTMPFWDSIFAEIAREFPDVRTESVHLDALLARMVRAPDSLDVVVASNLFGDLLTDLAGALMGSIGTAPAANLDPSGECPPMFEPVHGSAPDIAGLGIANPIGQIWTGVLMLEHLGMAEAAAAMLRSIEDTVLAGEVTPDLGGTLTTEEVGVAIMKYLARGS